MTFSSHSATARFPRTRAGLPLKSGACVVVVYVSFLVLGFAGFRVNLTPSERLGLWRIMPVERALHDGDVVFVCPPQTPAMHFARERGYLRNGLCRSGTAPLIKTVAAVAGQAITVAGDVRIDGHPLLHSQILPRDGIGRTLVAYSGGLVPADTVYLHSDFPGSFDSRYFGPLPVSGVLGLAHEVWTYAP